MAAHSPESDDDFNEGLILPSLIRQLRGILDQYPDDGQILKEVIQNAEDAGASKVIFLIDHTTYGTDPHKLHHADLARYQGPALYVYNDAVFNDEDWRGIRMLHESIKEDDPMKVGRFGLGFKSVFHMTDLPSIFSGDGIAFLDPHMRYFRKQIKGEVYGEPTSAYRWHLGRNKDDIKRLNHQFDPFVQPLFGISDTTFQEEKFKGTLLRFPFRTQQMLDQLSGSDAKKQLSSTIYDDDKVKDLVRSLAADSQHMLLFLKNVESVEVFEKFHADDRSPKKLLEIRISSSYVSAARANRKDFQSKVRDCKQWKTSDPVSVTFPLGFEVTDYQTESAVKASEWIVSLYHAGKDDAQHIRTDIDLSYLPQTGAAVKLELDLDAKDVCMMDPQGHIFCFLPLPLEKKSPTGLRFHVHGCFAIDQNRRHIKWPTADQTGLLKDPALIWNKFLVNDVLPRTMTHLTTYIIETQRKMTESQLELPRSLHEALKRKLSRNPEFLPRLVYAILPDKNNVSSQWKTLADVFTQEVLHRTMFFYTPGANGGRWLHWEDAIFDSLHKGDEESVFVRSVLYADGRNVAAVPEYVMKLLPSNASQIKVLQVCDSFRSVQYSMEVTDTNRRVLLHYLMRELKFPEDVAGLYGLQLLPLADGSWTEFSQLSHGVENVYVGSKEHPQSLLPGLKRHFLKLEVLPKEYKEVVQCGKTQLRYLDPNALVRLLPLLFADFKDKETITRGEAKWITNDWLKLLWKYLLTHFLPSLTQVENHHIFPISADRFIRLSRSSPVIAKRGNENQVLPNNVIQVCEKVDIYVVENIMEDIRNHPKIFDNYVLQPTAKGLLAAMFRVDRSRGNGHIVNTFHMIADKSRNDLRSFLSKGIRSGLLSADEKETLSLLPIFKTVDGSGRKGSHFVSFSMVHKAAPVTKYEKVPKIPVQSPEVLLDLEDEEVRFIAEQCSVRLPKIPDILVDLYFPAIIGNYYYGTSDVTRFMQYVCENLKQLQYISSQPIAKRGSEVSFVSVADGTLAQPGRLFDPSDQIVSRLFCGKPLFPFGEFAKPKYRDALIAMGMRDRHSLTAQEALDVANRISCETLEQTEKRNMAEALMKLLNERSDLLTHKLGYDWFSTDTLENKLSYLSWVVCHDQRPPHYPPALTYYGLSMTEKFATPSQARSLQYANLIGSICPLVDTKGIAALAKLYNWNEEPSAESVTRHLLNLVECYKPQEKTYALTSLQSVYCFFSDHLDQVSVVLELSADKRWIWNGDGFASVSQMALKKNTIDLKPYSYSLPSELEQYGKLWKRCELRERSNLSNVLRAINQAHEAGTENDVERDIRLSVNILNIIAQNGIQDDRGSLMIPINTRDGRLRMKPISDCTYVDKGWYLRGFDIDDMHENLFLIHETIPLKTAEKLEIPSLISRSLGIEELDIGYGQSEPLTTRLKSILRDYTDGLAVLKELIQNADDAGAKEICFLYDERRNEDARNILFDPMMKDLQGPALWTYNDAVFTKTDFDNIVRLSGATKEKETHKIGRFGLGFNAVYHLTDVPSFISDNYVVFFDPHTKYLGRDVSKAKPGIRLNLSTHQHKIQKMTDQFKPYNGIFGCNLGTNSDMPSYDGTLFRFPLRTTEQANTSEICRQQYCDTDMVKLLQLLEGAAHHLLLFTQNLQKISVYHLPESGSPPTDTRRCFSVERSLERPLRNNVEPVLDSGLTSLQSILTAGSQLIKMYRNRIRKGVPTLELSSVLRIALTYDDVVQSKFNGENSNDVSYWLVASCLGQEKSLQMALDDETLIPIGGVAAQLEKFGESSFKAISITHGLNSMGLVFCFMPLPIQYTLPVHINGFFAVHSSRTHLFERASLDKEDRRATWNEALIADAVSRAYVMLLEDLTTVSDGNDSYVIWPKAMSIKEVGQLPAHLLRCLYQSICSSSRIFKVDSGWTTLNDCILLSPKLCHEETAEMMRRVLKTVTILNYQITKKEVVDIPEPVVRTILQVDASKLLSPKFIHKGPFLTDWFLPNIRSIDPVTRDRLILHFLFTDEFSQDLVDVDCIPVSPDSEDLKCISELIHPECKTSVLYDADEGRFPMWRSGVVDDRKYRRKVFDKLVDLGMKKNKLSWEDIADRCTVIQSHPPSAHKRTAVVIDIMNRNLTKGYTPSAAVGRTLLRTKFLPVMKKPANFPLRWKGDEFGDCGLVSGYEGHLSCYKNVVCCSFPVIDDRTCFANDCDEAKKFLGLFKNIDPLVAVAQIHELMQADVGENAEKLRQYTEVYHDVFLFLEERIETSPVDVGWTHSLTNSSCILYDKTTLMLPQRCALSGDYGTVLPYLAVLPETTGHSYTKVLKTLGVKDKFSLTDFTWILNEANKKAQNRKLDAKELDTILYVINECIFHELSNNSDAQYCSDILSDLPIPNAAERLCPASSLCHDNCPWLAKKEDLNCCHSRISYEVARKIGIQTIRQGMMSRHRLAHPFGQKERLVKRIQRILEGYPFSEDIFKEMLQNADDAGASRIHFICDPRHLPDKMVFEDSWKPLQGPALCIFNDQSFTEDDLRGIQSLGEGSKSDDPVKTGQYGVGFNSVYHLTDVPTFMTTVENVGTVLCAFDPNCTYVPGATTTDPGGLFKVNEDLRSLFSDVFSGYLQDMENLSRFGEQEPKTLNVSRQGTLFRLPLRSESAAESSEILKKPASIRDLNKCFEKFKCDMYESLLFVNSVEEIHLEEVVDGNTDNADSMAVIRSVEENDQERTSDDGNGNRRHIIKPLYSVRLRMSDEARHKRSRFQHIIRETSKDLRDGKKQLNNIKMHEVCYEVTTEDSEKNEDVWQIVQRFGFHNPFTLPSTVTAAYKTGELGLMPVGGVAYLKKSSGSHAAKISRLFSFLPMPVPLPNLPVHINGHFVLDHETRRNLWTYENKTFQSEWNRCLMEDVVAPAYCTLIQTMSSPLRLGNLTSVDREVEMKKFFELFPDTDKSTAHYETNLTSAVYKFIGDENMEILPVRTGTEQLNGVKWSGPFGQLNKPAFFEDLSLQIKEPEPELVLLYRSSVIPYAISGSHTRKTKKCVVLRNALTRCGFGMFNCPVRLYYNFINANVEVKKINSSFVVDFFASYNEPKKQCRIGELPANIVDTPLEDVESLVVLLEYCKTDPDLKDKLDGLPLMMTNDLMLRVFDRHHPRYVTYHSDIAPHTPDLFINNQVARALDLNPKKDEMFCREFTVIEFSHLLSDLLPRSHFYGAHRTVPLESLQCVLADKTSPQLWLNKVWAFISSHFPITFSPDDCQLVRPSTVDVDSVVLPVSDWCLLPVISAEGGSLTSVSSRLGILDLGHEEQSEFDETLKELGAARPWLQHIGHTFLVSPGMVFFGDTRRPQCVLNSIKQLMLHHSLDGKLDNRKGLIVLSYFSENCQRLENPPETKDLLKKLPFYVTVYGKQTSLNRSKAYVLPNEIQGEDMERWTKMLNVVFLKSDESIAGLLQYLECEALTVADVYCRFIFKEFDKFSAEAQVTHMMCIRKHVKLLKECEASNESALQELSSLLDQLKDIRFIPSVNGDGEPVFARACQYYDNDNAVFKLMLQSDKFPPSPYDTPEWKAFLLDCGLIREIDEHLFVSFAKEIQSSGSQRSSNVGDKSAALLKYLLDSEALQSSSVPERIRGIAFIDPHVAGFTLRKLHTQYGSHDEDGKLSLISFENSTLHSNEYLVWTAQNILPRSVSETSFCGYIPDAEYHDERLRVFSRLMQRLSVTVEPELAVVVEHARKLCVNIDSQSMAEMDRLQIKTLFQVLKRIYSFLDSSKLDDTVRAILADTPFIVAPGCRRLLPPCHFVVNMLEETEIRPYLYKFPGKLSKFERVFLRLGTTKSPKMRQYAKVLAAIHSESAERELNPNEAAAVRKAMIGLLELLRKDKANTPDLPDELYFPSASGRLHLSSELVYADDECLRERLRELPNPFLIRPWECGILDESVAEKIFRKLKPTQCPKFLSEIIDEVIDSSEDAPPSRLIKRVQNQLATDEFKNGFQRIIVNCLAGSDLTAEQIQQKITEFCAVLSRFHFFTKRSLQTHLEFNRQKISSSSLSIKCLAQPDWEEGEQIWKVYVRNDINGKHDLYPLLAKLVNKHAGGCLVRHLMELAIILECQPENIHSMLDQQGLRKQGDSYRSFSLPLGSFVPMSKYCFLDYDTFQFNVGSIVALEVDDPLDRGERGAATYIFVEIIERLHDDDSSLFADRYRVKVSSDGDEQDVDASRLFGFRKRTTATETGDEPEEGLAISLAINPSTPYSSDAESNDYISIINKLKHELKEAWKLPEDQRRRVIKRLKFAWHPDKHSPEDAQLCTRVFQRLQNLIEMLERGENIDGEEVDEADIKRQKEQTCYDDIMGERARSYRDDWNRWQDSHRQRRGREDFHEYFHDFRTAPNPQPGEARRWMQQAKFDLEAANCDAANEWVCYKCHQAAEKSLRAVHFALDANKSHSYDTDNLSQLSGGLMHTELSDLSSKLQNLIRSSSYLRYPHQHTFPLTPHQAVDRDTGLTAVELSTKIVEFCEKFIEDHV